VALALLCLSFALIIGQFQLLTARAQDKTLADQATHIVIGRVENIRSFWSKDTIVTHVSLNVEDSDKGGLSVNSKITVKHYGGEVGSIGLLSSNQPLFMKGERTKLYLRIGKDGIFDILDGCKGKVSLEQQALSGSSTYAVDSPPHRWSYSELPIHYRINPTTPADVSSSAWTVAVQASFQTWEDDLGSIMDYTYDGTTTDLGPDPNTGGSRDYLNGVYAKGGFTSNALAVCWYWYDPSTGPAYYKILEFDIIFNTGFQWSASGQADRYDIQNVGTHEAGHTLSLKDLYGPADSEETMYGYSGLGETKSRTLNSGDIEGIRFLYPDHGIWERAWGTGGDLPLLGDIDGDGKSDLTIWRPSDGRWYILKSTSGYSASNPFIVSWGTRGDIPLMGYVDGDSKADLVIWRPSNGHWYILLSSIEYSLSSPLIHAWGTSGDIPLLGDIDGDGKADLVIWRPTNGIWYVLPSGSGYTASTAQLVAWGTKGDVPLIANFDALGVDDLIIWRPSNGHWYILSLPSTINIFAWGTKGDTALVGQVDSQARKDLLIWRVGNGYWYMLRSASDYSVAGSHIVAWGTTGDTPILGDMDVDSKADLVIWRSSNGRWYCYQSSGKY